MEKSNYLIQSIIDRISTVSEHAIEHNNDISYGEDLFRQSLESAGFDRAVIDRYEDHKNEHVAACLADGTERSARKFKEDENLKEVNLSVSLGKHDRIRSVVSRSYEDADGLVVDNHLLTEHKHTNSHLEGVQRLASSYFKAIAS